LKKQSLHTTPEKFENAIITTVILDLCLKKKLHHPTPEKFENAIITAVILDLRLKKTIASHHAGEI